VLLNRRHASPGRAGACQVVGVGEPGETGSCGACAGGRRTRAGGAGVPPGLVFHVHLRRLAALSAAERRRPARSWAWTSRRCVGRVFPYGVPLDVSQQGTLQALRDVVEMGKPVHYESYTRAPSGHPRARLEPGAVADQGRVRAGVRGRDGRVRQQRAALGRQRLAVLNEAAVSIGRSLDLVRTAQELTELVVPRFADFASVDLFEEVHARRRARRAAGHGRLLRRAAHLSPSTGFPGAVIDLGRATRTRRTPAGPGAAHRAGRAQRGQRGPGLRPLDGGVPDRAGRLERHR
jgi:hypothetical protein